MVILSLNIVSLNLIGNFFYWNETFVCMFSPFPVAFLKKPIYLWKYTWKVSFLCWLSTLYRCFLLGDKKLIQKKIKRHQLILQTTFGTGPFLSIIGHREKEYTGPPTYTTPHMNKTVNVDKIKHIFIVLVLPTKSVFKH